MYGIAKRFLPVVALAALGAGCSGADTRSDGELRATADEAMRRQEYSRVAVIDTELIRRQPDDFDATLQRGIANDRLGNTTAALSDYARAIELDPSRPLARLYRANAALRLGQPGLGRADAEAVLAMKAATSERVAALTLLGTVEQMQGRFGPAMAHYSRAVELGRTDADQHTAKHYRDALNNGAACQYKLGDFGAAIALMQELVEAKKRAGAPIMEDDHYTLGVLFYLNGKFADSKAHFKKVSPARRQHAATQLDDPNFFKAL